MIKTRQTKMSQAASCGSLRGLVNAPRFSAAQTQQGRVAGGNGAGESQRRDRSKAAGDNHRFVVVHIKRSLSDVKTCLNVYLIRLFMVH